MPKSRVRKNKETNQKKTSHTTSTHRRGGWPYNTLLFSLLLWSGVIPSMCTIRHKSQMPGEVNHLSFVPRNSTMTETCQELAKLLRLALPQRTQVQCNMQDEIDDVEVSHSAGTPRYHAWRIENIAIIMFMFLFYLCHL